MSALARDVDYERLIQLLYSPIMFPSVDTCKLKVCEKCFKALFRVGREEYIPGADIPVDHPNTLESLDPWTRIESDVVRINVEYYSPSTTAKRARTR